LIHIVLNLLSPLLLAVDPAEDLRLDEGVVQVVDEDPKVGTRRFSSMATVTSSSQSADQRTPDGIRLGESLHVHHPALLGDPHLLVVVGVFRPEEGGLLLSINIVSLIPTMFSGAHSIHGVHGVLYQKDDPLAG
jgi:hypothetical protein